MKPVLITAYSAKDFRTWLKKNHKKESKMAVIVHKKHTGKTSPSHRELIEEAICFGWIDTTIKRLDEDTYMRNFSKRTTSSKWSENTLSYAKRLIKEGRMSEEGMRFYKLGKARPTHDHGIPKNPDMPAELREALSKNAKAKKNFELYAPSLKRAIFRSILRGKQEGTRQRSAAKIVKIASKKLRPTL